MGVFLGQSGPKDRYHECWPTLFEYENKVI